jgi:hypothetical protein
MNFEKGKIISVIKDLENEKKRSKKKDNKFLYVDDKANNSIDSYECDYNETIQQIPDKETERSILYITGPSGSGKSYYTRNYILEYKKMFSKNNIYVSGGTCSNNFFTNSNSYKPFLTDTINPDAFVVSISSDGSKVLSGTYFGSIYYDQSYFIEISNDDKIYITGQT